MFVDCVISCKSWVEVSTIFTKNLAWIISFSCACEIRYHLQIVRSNWAPYLKRILPELFHSCVFVDCVIMCKSFGRIEQHIENESWMNYWILVCSSITCQILNLCHPSGEIFELDLCFNFSLLMCGSILWWTVRPSLRFGKYLTGIFVPIIRFLPVCRFCNEIHMFP